MMPWWQLLIVLVLSVAFSGFIIIGSEWQVHQERKAKRTRDELHKKIKSLPDHH